MHIQGGKRESKTQQDKCHVRTSYLQSYVFAADTVMDSLLAPRTTNSFN